MIPILTGTGVDVNLTGPGSPHPGSLSRLISHPGIAWFQPERLL